MSEISRELASLTPEQRALLELRLKRKTAPPMAPEISRSPRRDFHALSFAQRRMWFFDQMVPGSAAYNIPLTVRISGPLVPGALSASLSTLVARHESLRTTFHLVDGEPVQRIHAREGLALTAVDLEALPAEAREERALAICQEEMHRPFDLRTGPVFRAMLIRLGTLDHILVITMHHIVSDAWSVSIVLRELSELYRARVEGGRAKLPELPVQYVDYASWQRAEILGEGLDAELAYWKQKLGGDLPVLSLPTDRPRPAVASFRGSRRAFTVQESVISELRELGRSSETTLFTVLLAAFAALLHRYTGEEDILVGAPVAGRNQVELEDLIGFFVNSLVLRVDLSGRPSFRELLSRASKTTLDAFMHQNLPFDLLVSELEPERDLGRNPLFQVALSMHNTPRQDFSLAGLELRPIALAPDRSRFDLALSVVEAPGGLYGVMEYRSDLFEGATIDRMLSHYRILLEEVTAEPDGSISELPLTTSEERERVVRSWNGRANAYGRERSIVSIFEERVREGRERVAIRYGGRALTYGELDSRSSRLARRLQGQGIAGEAVVGLCLERSPEMVVGMLGILKAGAAYLPLDPSYPDERLAVMSADSGAGHVVTSRDLAARFEASGLRLVVVEEVESSLDESEESEDTTLVPSNGDSLAYVIFTSGSTGKAKGVAVPHRAVVRLVRATDYVQLGPGDVVAQASNASFDAATFEVWGALLSGARLEGFGKEELLSPGDLKRLLRDRGVSVLFLTTALFNQLSREEPGIFSSLRALLFGGEAVDPVRVRAVLERGRPERLLHVYGPTENATFSSWHEVRVVAEEAMTVPIGRAIANSTLYVLDPELEPSAVGVAGELYVGGDGLARGYLGRPDLTAEKFVPNPFGPRGGERLYRTGDRARWNAEGGVEFLGRTDQQVKIRGFRVEPGEVESVLLSRSDLKHAVVVAREDEAGDKRLVAYVVPADGGGKKEMADELRDDLRRKLPAYMVPSRVVILEALPLNENGKVDRKALPRPEAPSADSSRVVAESDTEKTIAAIWTEVLGVPDVSIHDNFFDLGGHSLLLVRVHARLNESFDHAIPVVDLFRYPTVHSLAAHLSGNAGAEEETSRLPARIVPSSAESRDVAVVAMAGRFPGAPSVEALWDNLVSGVESIRFFTRDELLAANIDEADVNSAAYVPASAPLDDVDLFDAGFFKMPPREAEMLDPQHRLFLETVWEALERAACDPSRYQGKIGLYAGSGNNRYGSPGSLGTLKDFLTTRASYKLNLTGPSLDVQTACSTSLVAVHLACQALLNRECDLALAGGVTVRVPQETGYFYHEDGINSPDGHCRAFDADARGTVPGSGVAVVALKRLADALADGDSIHAVVKGTAINNDGSLKVGFTAPGVAGQAEAIASALARAGVRPESLSYVEAHGTATPLGDPAEVRALTQVFREGKRGSIALGSLKSNVGHLDAAAGVAGLIKAVLALEHRQIPPSLHYRRPNPAIDFDSGPFFVNTELREWSSSTEARRAGVSSFGMGGTNAHAVLEEAPPRPPSDPAEAWQLLPLSAQSQAALDATSSNLMRHLAKRPDENLADVAFTLQTGRKAFERRRAAVCRDREHALAVLEGLDPKGLLSSRAPTRSPSVAFLFPGQGVQHVGMAEELYRCEPLFRSEIDACAESLAPRLGADLRDVLFPTTERVSLAESRLTETELTQSALFSIEYALARLWMDAGVTPASLIGHSLGEYVAAAIAGVFSREDALRLVAARGRLMQSVPRGAMLAVGCDPDRLTELGDDVAIAAVNAPGLTVLSGSIQSIEAISSLLSAEGVDVHRLKVSHAFHSPMMAPILPAFAEELASVPLQEPRIPFLSNLTGAWIRASEATDPDYWVRHLRETVRFQEAMGRLLAEHQGILLEVGPGQTLGGLARRHPTFGGAHEIVSSLGSPSSPVGARESFLGAASRLWLSGVELDFEALHRGRRRRRVLLPTYPFERRRFWLSPSAGRGPEPSSPVKKRELDDWFYLPSWKQTMSPRSSRPEENRGGRCRLVFADARSLGERVASLLREGGETVVEVEAGDEYRPLEGSRSRIRPAEPEDYLRLLKDLERRGLPPGSIVHLWGTEGAYERAFYSLLHLGRAIAEANLPNPIEIVLATEGAHDVVGDEDLFPERATMLGPLKVLPQELAGVSCRNVDFSLPPGGLFGASEAEALFRELSLASNDRVVAFRNRRRWTLAYEPVRVPAAEGRLGLLKDRGVYLITGGLGQVGLSIATYLAKTLRARLLLTTRSPLPDRDRWGELSRTLPAGDELRLRLSRLLEIEEAFGEVEVVAADVTELASMKKAVARAVERFGGLDGVVHAAGARKVAGPIVTATLEECEAQFSPRLRGLQVLDEALRGRDLDFVFVTSSLASILGVTGFVAYSSAHAFMDAFVQAKNREGDVPWIGVNWDNWASPSQRTGDAMAPEGALEAFARILAADWRGLVAVSTSDLGARIEKWIDRPGRPAEPDEASRLSDRAHERPALATSYVAPRNDVEGVLAAIWQGLLGIERVGVHDDFFELGGDSVIGIQLVSRAKAAGIRVKARDVFEHPTVAELAAAVRGNGGTAAEEGPLEGPIVPLPIQRWFFEKEIADPHHFNLAMALEPAEPLEPAPLQRAWRALFEQHDALRLRSVPGEAGVALELAKAEPPSPVLWMEIGGADERAVIEERSKALQSELRLEAYPLGRAAYFSRGNEKPGVLVLVFHHLVVDAVSFRILLEDLETAYRQARRGEEVRLPAKTTSLARWGRLLRDLAQTEVTLAESEYWAALPWEQVGPIPLDFPGGKNLFESFDVVETKIDRRATDFLLLEAPRALRAHANEVLLAALVKALADWTKRPAVLVHLEGHGREPLSDDVDLSRTVGWFTNLYPALVRVDWDDAPLAALESVRDQLRAIPRNGLGYGMLRNLSERESVRERFRALPEAQVSFLYLGRFDALSESGWLRPAGFPIGLPRSLRGKRLHALEVTAMAGDLGDGALRLRWAFSRDLHRRSTIQAVAERFQKELEKLLQASSASGGSMEQPSAEFAGARLSPSELERFLSRIRRPRGGAGP